MEEFERYTPVNPLPEEIRKLERDETVCKFCGVSYLIHSEMKKLEEKLKEALAQLTDYHEIKEKYGDITSQLALKTSYAASLENNMASVEQHRDELARQVVEQKSRLRKHEMELKNLTDQKDEKDAELNKLNSQLALLSGVVKQLPEVLKQVYVLKSKKENLLSAVKSHKDGILAELSQLLNRNKEAGTLSSDNSARISSLEAQISADSIKKKELAERLSSISREKECLSKEIEECTLTKQQNKELTTLIATSQIQFDEKKAEVEKLSNKLADLEKQLQIKENDIGTLKEDLEDVKARHVHQISALNAKYENSMDVHRTLQEQMSVQVTQFNSMKEENGKLCVQLKREKDDLEKQLATLSTRLSSEEHHHRDTIEKQKLQMSSLHKTYQQEITELTKTIERLEAELKVANGHKVDVEAVVHKAISQVHVQHEAELAKHTSNQKEAQNKLEDQINILSAKYEEDLQLKERTLRDIKQSFGVQISELEREKDSLVQARISAEHRLRDEVDALRRLKETALSPERADALKARNSQLEAEVLGLQRVVQRECEERLELTMLLEEKKKQTPFPNRPKATSNKLTKPAGRVRKS